MEKYHFNLEPQDNKHLAALSGKNNKNLKQIVRAYKDNKWL